MHFDDGSNPWIHSEHYVQVFKFGNSGTAACGDTAGSLIIFIACYIYMRIAAAG
jgi:hypothetical protein